MLSRIKNILAVPVILNINSSYKPGKFEKSITIKTNDSIRSEIHVTIKGIIVGEAKALPQILFWGEIKPNTTVVREATISPTNGKKLEIVRIDQNSQYITTVLIPIENSLKYTLKATLKSPDKTITVRDTLRVYVNGHDYPDLAIPLYARIVAKKSNT